MERHLGEEALQGPMDVRAHLEALAAEGERLRRAVECVDADGAALARVAEELFLLAIARVVHGAGGPGDAYIAACQSVTGRPGEESAPIA